MRIKLIANPVSGGDARPRIQRAVAELQKLGAEVEPYLTTGRGDARVVAAKAVAEGFDRIVAAGGDGTLNEVVNGAAESEVPIAFLPFGTVNVFALEAGIPKPLEQACALAVHGLPRRITLGKINGDLFLLMASAGWDAEVVAAVRGGLKRLIGRLAYAVSALETLLRREPVPLELITHEGKRLTGYGAVVSNCRYYGGRYMVTPGASMLRNDLEVCLLREGGRLAIVKFAAALLLKRPLMPPLVEFYTITSAMLQGQNIAVQVDGDARGTLPARIEVVPEAVAMVVPDAACSNP
ncbi:MAG: diacylglycerol/lipid kinase family protein [Desulfuromonadales bacterium]